MELASRDEATTTAALEVLQGALDDAIVGVWLHGSAVLGNLRPDSDLDLLVVTRRAVVRETRRHLVDGLLAVSGRVDDPVRRQLEVIVVVRADVVPWPYPPRADLVYGEWIRDELENGEIPPPAADPDLAVVLAGARQHSRQLLGPPARNVLDDVPSSDLRRAIIDHLPTLLDGIRGDERNVLLTLARMWATLATGRILSKDDAAEWAINRLPRARQVVMRDARMAYLGERRDDWVGREYEVEIFVRTIQATIASLAPGRR